MPKRTPQVVYEDARYTMVKILHDLKSVTKHMPPDSDLKHILSYASGDSSVTVEDNSIAFPASNAFCDLFPEEIGNFVGIPKDDPFVASLKNLRDHPPESLTTQPAWKHIQHTLNFLLHLVTIFPMLERCEQEGGLWAGIKSFFQAEPMQELRQVDNELKKIQRAYAEYQAANPVTTPDQQPSMQ